MVTKCANPSCNAVFRYLRDGRLFLVERPSLPHGQEEDFGSTFHRSEYFWLCADCCLTMTIAADRNGQPVITSRTHDYVEPLVATRNGR